MVAVPEFVWWCAKHFDPENRIIGAVKPISLSPMVFHRMLRLPEANKEFRITEANGLITNQGGPKRLFPQFTDSLSRIKTNSFHFDIGLLKEPFKEFSWLFALITGQESTTMFCWCVLYFLHGTFNMDFKFDWAQVVSSEISHQLSIYQEIERFFMMAYLVYAIIYNSIVNEFLTRKDVDVNVGPI